jgi:hypothetical protein
MSEYSQTDNGLYWFRARTKETHKDIFAHLGYLDKQQSYRSIDNLRYARLYGNYEMAGLDAYSYTRVETSYSPTNRVTLNVIQSMIDTVSSKITKNKPKPTFLTDGGDWSLQQKAKKLTKYVDGVFTGTDFYQHAARAFIDSCIFGTGAIKIFREDNEIKAERVFIEELKTDDIEGFYGDVRNLHQVKFVHKDVLKSSFPEHAVAIENANHSENLYNSNYMGSASAKDMVMVVESWHLPSKKDAGDGRRTITISNADLLDEPYEKMFMPFVFFRWTEKPVGFFGQGLAEQLQGIQLEINKILRTIQVSMHLVSVPKLLVEASSKIVTAHLNNKIGGIIKYAGTPPEYAPLGSIPRELFSHLDRLYQRAYEIAGISQLSAQSQKPSGLDSGKALREFNDIESERFMSVGIRYEKAFIDAAKIIVNMSRDIYKDTGSAKVKVKGKSFIETIDWNEVDIADDKYLMDIFPTSSLSKTPSGRLQDVIELLQAGFISREDGLKLLDFPDLESTLNLSNAALEDIERMIEQMIDKGEYFPPEPFQNLALGIQKVQQAYLYYKGQSAPEERLELLRQWMEDAKGLIDKAQIEAQAQQAIASAEAGAAVQGAQQQEPIANPEPAPTSDLLPQG